MKKFVLLLFLFPAFLFSQQRKIDSVLVLLKNDKLDTIRVQHLIFLCDQLRLVGNYDSAFVVGNDALQYAQQLKYETGIAGAYNDRALVYLKQGKYEKSMSDQLNALSIYEKQSNQKGISTCYNNIGILYKVQGVYTVALEYYFKSLKIREALGDKNDIGGSYNNIGLIYDAEGNDTLAIENYSKALTMMEAAGNKQNIATVYGNLGLGYNGLKDYPKALLNFQKSLELFQKLKSKSGISRAYNNIGEVYGMQHNNDSSLKYHLMSLAIAEQIGNKPSMVISYDNIGAVYLAMGQVPKAIEYGKKGLALAQEIGSKDDIKEAYHLLSDAYHAQHDDQKAYANFLLYISYKDSLLNDENTRKTVRYQMTYDFEKQSASDSLKNAARAKLKEVETQAKLRDEQTKRYGLYAGIGLLLVFGGFIFNRFRVTKKQKQIIEIKSKETEHQKEIIEDKQKEIVDSINYAKRIQSAILPDLTEVETSFTDAFILFQPKDIVSGDFFWMAKTSEYIFVAAADCTGHGVPGGFMSMLGSSLLNEVVIEKKIIEPGEILDMMRIKIILALKQKGDSGENKDGMDMVLCRFNRNSNELAFAAANNPLWIVSNGNLKEWKADKQPVGIFTGDLKMFTQHSISLQKNDAIYLFTDGFADQFGGPKGKKFKYKQMEELLLKNSALSMPEQKNILESEFQSWKGNLEQVDDVLVIGIRI